MDADRSGYPDVHWACWQAGRLAPVRSDLVALTAEPVAVAVTALASAYCLTGCPVELAAK